MSEPPSAALAVLLLRMLAALPVAAAAGSETCTHQRAQAVRQAAERHRAVAVLLAAAPAMPGQAGGSPVRMEAEVPARWQLPDGSSREGTVTVAKGTVR
ncbi:hypothetical protein [Amycolatopsis aidingensis]|uniref:hypothetical protein n=1 Tax=Amycolatopsis aidingensis TaxID=2842453 RepID=UPI001C0E57B6|nr:hypothetical protein [Amycolatopsis aidingensis]